MPDKALSYTAADVHHPRMSIADLKVTPCARLLLRSGGAETASNATFVTFESDAA